MYRLFAAAQAMAFSVGCHARCSSLVVESNAFPFASTTALSAPDFHATHHTVTLTQKEQHWTNVRSKLKIIRLIVMKLT